MIRKNYKLNTRFFKKSNKKYDGNNKNVLFRLNYNQLNRLNLAEFCEATIPMACFKN
jgi:hypothetical protein